MEHTERRGVTTHPESSVQKKSGVSRRDLSSRSTKLVGKRSGSANQDRVNNRSRLPSGNIRTGSASRRKALVETAVVPEAAVAINKGTRPAVNAISTAHLIDVILEEGGAEGGGRDELTDYDAGSIDTGGTWAPNIYQGGAPLPASLQALGRPYYGGSLRDDADDLSGSASGTDAEEEDGDAALDELFARHTEIHLHGHDSPSPWRVQVVAVVTTGARNSTALDCVQRIFEHLRRGTSHDPRVAYQTICLAEEDDAVSTVPCLRCVFEFNVYSTIVFSRSRR
jgi:hypothetical protein